MLVLLKAAVRAAISLEHALCFRVVVGGVRGHLLDCWHEDHDDEDADREPAWQRATGSCAAAPGGSAKQVPPAAVPPGLHALARELVQRLAAPGETMVAFVPGTAEAVELRGALGALA